MKLLIKKGTTSKRIEIFIQDSASPNGSGKTGLAFNTSGLVWYYSREDDGNVGATAVTLATMTRGTWAPGGFVEKDATNFPGVYQIGIPNAILASGATWAVMKLNGAAGMVPVPIEIQLVDFDLGGSEGSRLSYSAQGMIVSTVTGSPSTTGFIDTTLTQATNDHWKDRTVVFLSGAAAGQAKTITGFNATTHALTFNAVTAAASIGDVYAII